MSAKQEKKRRKFLRKLFQKQYKNTAVEIANEHSKFLKPKPRWMPQWLWLKFIGCFLILKK